MGEPILKRENLQLLEDGLYKIMDNNPNTPTAGIALDLLSHLVVLEHKASGAHRQVIETNAGYIVLCGYDTARDVERAKNDCERLLCGLAILQPQCLQDVLAPYRKGE